MKIPPIRRTGKTSRKVNRTRLKPKIRWDRLGLQDPVKVAPTQSMADIRREIISMASRGLGPDTYSRSTTNDAQSLSAAEGRMSLRKRRRGATE